MENKRSRERRRRWTSLTGTCVALLLGVGAITTTGAQAVELRAGCGFPKGDVFCDGVDKFSELVKAKTNGEVIVRVFYRELGAEHQLTQAVMSGAVDMGMITGGNAARFSSAFMLYDLPFLFRTHRAMLESLDGPIGKQAIEQFENDLGVKFLMPLSPGRGRDVQTTKKLVKTPADFEGMKIRVVSTPIDLATFKAWGANPTPLDWGQTYTALQQGLVEGIGISPAAFLSSKMYEACQYLTLVDYQPIWENFFMNGARFASLSEEHQKALLDAAEETKPWHREYSAEYNEKSLAELKKQGIEIYEPTAQERAEWEAIRDSVWEDVAKQEEGRIDLEVARDLLASQP